MAREPARGRGAPANTERGRREASGRALDKIMNTSLEESQRENNRFNYGKEAKSAFEEWAASDEGRAAIERESGTGAGGRAAAQRRSAARARLEERFVNRYVDRRGERVLKGLSSRQEESARGAGGGGRSSQPKPEIKPPTNQEVEFRAESNIDERSFRTQRSAGNSFDIAQFRENIVNNVLPTHSFLVVFSPMRWVDTKAAGASSTTRDLTMRCENAILPQLGLLQQDNLRRYGYGPIENVPYGYNMGDFTLQFIVDNDARIINFFESWTNFIVNRDSYGGATMTKLGQFPKPYEVAYKDDYVCPSVNVFVYDRSQNLIFEYNIYDVYPNNIQSMNLSWGDENQLMRLNVGFSFTDMRIRTAYDPQSYGPDTRPFVDIAAIDPGPLGRNVTDLGILAIDPTTNISQAVATDNLDQPISIGDVNVPVVPGPPPAQTFRLTSPEETFTELNINPTTLLGSI